MLEKLEAFEKDLDALDKKIADPETMKDMKVFKALMQERAHLAPIVEELQHLKKISEQLSESEELLKAENDPDMIEMTKEEISGLKDEVEASITRAKILRIPPDPLAGKNIIMEIRAGTGGEEAALFAADLYRMYTHYAEAKHWKIEIITLNETGLGGIKELICSISGKDVYGSLRWESGGHRVQRVPETEAGGRIHTSACTVAVLPEAEEFPQPTRPVTIVAASNNATSFFFMFFNII